MEKIKTLLRKIDSITGVRIDDVFGRTIYPYAKYLRYSHFHSKPRFVKIETTNFCNSKCLYCPHKDLRRKKGFMKESLFRKIINECVSWKIKEIHLCNFGEPLVDRKITERIGYVKKKGNFIKTIIFTNGGLLTKEMSKKLMKAGLDEMWISFDGFSKEHYEKYRYPLKYDLVVKNIENVVEIKKKLKTRTKIILQPVYDKNTVTYNQLKEFERRWNGIVGKIHIQKIHDWHGYIFKNDYKRRKVICRDIFQYMTINWDGSVVPCCLDYEGEHVLGDTNKNTIKEIWFGEQFMDFRSKLLNDVSSFSMCSKCRMMSYNFEYPYLSSIFW